MTARHVKRRTAGLVQRWRLAAAPAAVLVLTPLGGVAQLAAPASGAPACAGTPPTTAPAAARARPAGSPLKLPALPLRTSGARIVDRAGAEVHLASVNWYGAEERDYVVGGLDQQPLDTIAAEIRALGFNSVRLPWSNALLHDNPVVCDAGVAANPALRGRRALTVLDAVVTALGRQGLMVILDNHQTTADWCCLPTAEDSLWYNAGVNASDPGWVQGFHSAQWLADWQTMARRYSGPRYRNVIAADLRNEPRDGARWGPATGSTPGCQPPAQDSPDWRDAAERGAACVLGANPSLLVMVEGVAYSLDFGGPVTAPIAMPGAHAHQLVYSPHDYEEDHAPEVNADPVRLDALLTQSWGRLATGPDAAPIWIGEFGTCHTAQLGCGDNHDHSHEWFLSLVQYIGAHDLGSSYWPLNGTQSRGATRTFGAEETFGVLDTSWRCPASPALAATLRSLPGAGRSHPPLCSR